MATPSQLSDLDKARLFLRAVNSYTLAEAALRRREKLKLALRSLVDGLLSQWRRTEAQARSLPPQEAAWLRLHASLIRRGRDPNFELGAFIDYVLGITVYHQWLSRQEDGRQRLANIQLLKGLAEGLPDRSLGGFLGAMALLEDAGREDKRPTVNLMAIHASKGLEFRSVFVTGLEEGLIPLLHGARGNGQAEMEEELRVLYVAVTRARERFYLTGARTRQVKRPANGPPALSLPKAAATWVAGRCFPGRHRGRRQTLRVSPLDIGDLLPEEVKDLVLAGYLSRQKGALS